MPRRKQAARPKAPKGTAANQRIEFCYHPNLNKPEGEVYLYLLRNPVWSLEQGKAMANDAIVNRFLAYARQQNRPDLGKATAQHCIRQFLRCIDELCRDFELAHPLTSGITPVQASVTSSLVNTAETSSSSPEPIAIEAEYGKYNLFEDS